MCFELAILVFMLRHVSTIARASPLAHPRPPNPKPHPHHLPCPSPDLLLLAGWLNAVACFGFNEKWDLAPGFLIVVLISHGTSFGRICRQRDPLSQPLLCPQTCTNTNTTLMSQTPSQGTCKCSSWLTSRLSHVISEKLLCTPKA